MASRFVIPEPKLGQRWRHRDQGPSWRIIDIQDDVIIVSGPGPGRSIKYIYKQEFMAEWMPV
jgi:hypothetical protein